MVDDIKDWLSKTGYPLEMFVHKTVLSKSYLCEKSPIYSDAELGVAREIDLAAFHHGMCTDEYSYSIQLIFECKKSEKPLLVLSEFSSLAERYENFFGDDSISNDGPAAGFLGYSNLKNLSHEQRLESIGRFSEIIYSGYSVIPTFSKSDENIYKGIMGLASATEAYRNKYYEFFQSIRNEKTFHMTDRNPFQLLMPILVVDAKLYNAYLTDAGETNIEETDWASISIRLPWMLGKDGDERLCNIQIVRKDALGSFLDAVGQLHKYISKPEIVSGAVIRSTQTQNSIAFLRRLLRR